ncbi:MAG: serine hydrolase [Anaerolineales bacterium]|nr:serine hydrolase [Anaerolineales bacterium]
MSRKGAFVWIEWGVIILTVIAVAMLVIQLNSYSNFRQRFPAGLTIAGVDVGGLSDDEAERQLTAVYSSEIDLYYQGERIPLEPADVEFDLQLDPMLQQAGEQRDAQGFWTGFWDFLLNRPVDVEPISLQSSFSKRHLQAILANIAATRDAPAQPPVPVPATLNFQPGEAGYQMNIEASQPLVEAVLISPIDRQATLVVDQLPPLPPTMDILGRLLENHLSDFDGIHAFYIIDLETGERYGVNEDVAFSGMSIVKVPILVETFRTLDQEPNIEETKLLTQTMIDSGNFTANLLLDVIAGEDNGMLGAQKVTESMWYLGLENTFIAVPYEEDLPGTYNTPANERTDINTLPDPKMQTTPRDMGMLLEMIYQCAGGGGTLLAAYPGEITASECRLMLEIMNENRIGSLIEAGIPEGTSVAHKHGWTAETHGDAGIVFSPGGDYVLVEYMHTPGWLEWQISSPLLADISRATYNYFNFEGR